MLEGSGISVVEVDDPHQPLRVDLDNVYIDKRVCTSDITVLAFAAGLSQDVNSVYKGPKNFETIILSQVSLAWEKMFSYLDRGMPPTNGISEKEGISVFRRLCTHDLPEFIKANTKVTSRREVKDKAISIVFTFDFHRVSPNSTDRCTKSYAISGLWDDESQTYLPCASTSDKNKCSSILNKQNKSLTVEEFQQRLRLVTGVQNSSGRIGASYVGLFGEIYCSRLILFPIYEWVVKDRYMPQQMMGLYVPTVELGQNVVKFGGYDMLKDAILQPEHLGHLVRNKLQEWSVTSQKKYAVYVDAEQSKSDLISFIEGYSDNVMLTSLIQVWHVDGGVAFLNNTGDLNNILAVRYDKENNTLAVLACMLKGNSAAGEIVLYAKDMVDVELRAIVDRAFLGFKLL